MGSEAVSCSDGRWQYLNHRDEHHQTRDSLQSCVVHIAAMMLLLRSIVFTLNNLAAAAFIRKPILQHNTCSEAQIGSEAQSAVVRQTILQ